MRIDHLALTNFKGFASCQFSLDPRFNLFVGDNATGKTSVLDAISIALDSWFLGMKGVEKAGGIDSDDVRLVPHHHADSVTFEKQFPARIEARGTVLSREIGWARELNREGGRTTTAGAKELSDLASDAERAVRNGESIVLPLICSYGTERLWFESRHWKRPRREDSSLQRPSRFDGYRDCNVFEIQETVLIDWIRSQVSASQQRGEEIKALSVMKEAIASCVEDAESIYYDERYKELIVVMRHFGRQMFRFLSDGQRIMLTLVGDLVKRAVTLNPDLGSEVLRLTPGVVVIDELDLHLHPKWQRRVIHDLKRTFPKIQFIATTHSPQLIGEALPREIRILEDGGVSIPPRSYGLDSSRILEEVMHTSSRNPETKNLLSRFAELIDREDLVAAKSVLTEVEKELGKDDAEVTGANTLIDLLESAQ